MKKAEIINKTISITNIFKENTSAQKVDKNESRRNMLNRQDKYYTFLFKNGSFIPDLAKIIN